MTNYRRNFIAGGSFQAPAHFLMEFSNSGVRNLAARCAAPRTDAADRQIEGLPVEGITTIFGNYGDSALN